MKKIYVIAGEASGDLHGANLIKNLKNLSREPLEIYGVGGEHIRQTGAREFLDLAHFHVTGVTDAIKRMPDYKKAAIELFDKIKTVRPDVAVLIDNPGFNLHMAQKIHALHIPIVYYIAPQVWAWAPKRIEKIKRCVRKVLVVFEFEKKIYEENKIAVSWVGHPLIDIVKSGKNDVSPVKKDGFRVALLPGSRKGELKMLMPVFLKAAEEISKKFPDSSFSLLRASSLPGGFYDRLLKNSPVSIRQVGENHYDEIAASDLAIVCSGTATLECALLGTPMVICYKGTLITYLAAKSLIQVRFLGLPNLILGEERFPELLQYDATPKKIAAAAMRILTHETVYKRMKSDLAKVGEKLGSSGANERAALEILKVLSGEG